MMVIRKDYNNDKYGWLLENYGDVFFDVGGGGHSYNDAGAVIALRRWWMSCVL